MVWVMLLQPNTYVLIIMPDAPTRSSARIFREAGLEVRQEVRSAQGLRRILERDPGAIVIAEEMPALDGLMVLPLLRRLTKAPVLMVGDGGEMPIVDALSGGADMYMTRPINPIEMLARLRALLRRSESNRIDP